MLVVDSGINVAIGEKQIEPAVIVIIEEAGAPTQKWNGRVCDTRGIAHISKTGLAVVAIECVVVVGKVGDRKIHLAIAVVVADSNSHRRLLAAFVVERET